MAVPEDIQDNNDKYHGYIKSDQNTQNQHPSSYDSDDGGSTRLNINTAAEEELQGLPGIGPVLAGRIIEYRERCGPFREADDLLGVEGIGPSKLNDIRGLIDVRPGS